MTVVIVNTTRPLKAHYSPPAQWPSDPQNFNPRTEPSDPSSTTLTSHLPTKLEPLKQPSDQRTLDCQRSSSHASCHKPTIPPQTDGPLTDGHMQIVGGPYKEKYPH